MPSAFALLKNELLHSHAESALTTGAEEILFTTPLEDCFTGVYFQRDLGTSGTTQAGSYHLNSSAHIRLEFKTH